MFGFDQNISIGFSKAVTLSKRLWFQQTHQPSTAPRARALTLLLPVLWAALTPAKSLCPCAEGQPPVQRPGRARRVIPGAPERSPARGLGVDSVEERSPRPQRLPKPSFASHAPARRPGHTEAQLGSTARPGELLILDQFLHQTSQMRERQRGPGAPHRSREPRRSPGGPAAQARPRGRAGSAAGPPREPPGRSSAAPRRDRPRAHGPRASWVSGAPGRAAPPLPAGHGSPRCRRRGCRCSARRPWPQTRRDGDVAPRAAPARRQAGPYGGREGPRPRASPTPVAPWRPKVAAPCAGRGLPTVLDGKS